MQKYIAKYPKFKMKFLFIASFVLVTSGFCLTKIPEQSHPRVITPLGLIEGYYKISESGRRYEAYEGIPYAHPPTGDLRFRDPKRISPWTGVLMAKKFGSPCMQYNFLLRDPMADKLLGAEDCLYLNVYTPIMDDNHNKTQTNLVPVIFFIYGGAFVFGNGNQYGSKYLLDRNVTLVTFHYRLGPLDNLNIYAIRFSQHRGRGSSVLLTDSINPAMTSHFNTCISQDRMNSALKLSQILGTKIFGELSIHMRMSSNRQTFVSKNTILIIVLFRIIIYTYYNLISELQNLR